MPSGGATALDEYNESRCSSLTARPLLLAEQSSYLLANILVGIGNAQKGRELHCQALGCYSQVLCEACRSIAGLRKLSVISNDSDDDAQALKVIKAVETEDRAWREKISEATASILVNRALALMQVPTFFAAFNASTP